MKRNTPGLIPRRMACPYCRKEFDSRGYTNHVTSCNALSKKPRKRQ